MTVPTEPKARSPRVKPGIAISDRARARIQDYLDRSVPEKHKIATERALFKKIPPSAAIKQKCLSCCNYSREDVRECNVVICPLNPYRPYQGSLPEADE